MQNIKSYLLLRRYRRITALLVIVSVIAFVARPSLLASSAAEQGKRQKYSGEKIFRGLLFGEQGPIAEMFPQIWKNPQVVEQMKSEKRMQHWNEFKERVVRELKNRDQTFFDRFGEAMQSGDHIKIVDGLNEAGTLIRQALTEAEQAAANKGMAPTNSKKQTAKAGGPIMVKAAMSQPQDPTTTCEYGICVTEDDYGVTVFEDAANPQDVTANACSAVAVCALALLVAVWKWAVLVDVAAVVFVAAVVVAVWKWKYTYNRMEISDTQYLFQDMLVEDVRENLYLIQ
jgi:SdpC family antimicrobial peptide